MESQFELDSQFSNEIIWYLDFVGEILNNLMLEGMIRQQTNAPSSSSSSSFAQSIHSRSFPAQMLILNEHFVEIFERFFTDETPNEILLLKNTSTETIDFV